jgi:hypothetical protein
MKNSVGPDYHGPSWHIAGDHGVGPNGGTRPDLQLSQNFGSSPEINSVFYHRHIFYIEIPSSQGHLVPNNNMAPQLDIASHHDSLRMGKEGRGRKGSSYVASRKQEKYPADKS